MLKPAVATPRSFAFDLAGRLRRFWEISFTRPDSVNRTSLALGAMAGAIVGFNSGFENRYTETFYAHGFIGQLIAFLLAASVIGLPVVAASNFVGSIFSWTIRLCTTPIADSPSATASEAYRSDRRISLMLGLVAGVPTACFLFFYSSGSLIQRTAFAVMLAAGFGIFIGFGSGTVPLLKCAEIILVCRGLGRVDFQRLFTEANNRQLLRQAGAIYQFRHQVIQDYLAAISVETPPRIAPAAQVLESGTTPK